VDEMILRGDYRFLSSNALLKTKDHHCHRFIRWIWWSHTIWVELSPIYLPYHSQQYK